MRTSRHFNDRKRQRRIKDGEIKKTLENPCKTDVKGEGVRYFNGKSRNNVWIIVVVVVGVGAAVTAGAIAGIGAGTAVTLVTTYLKHK